MQSILIDTSFAVALNFLKDKNHQRALEFSRSSDYLPLIPEVALTETTFLLRRNGGLLAEMRFLDKLGIGQAIIQPLILSDIQRSREIMVAYSDAQFDFVDCCLMALSERLNITRVCTFDRRDFAIFRPKHCDYLELLP